MEQIEQQKKTLNSFVNPFFGEILPVSLSEGPNFWVAFQHKDWGHS